MSARPHPLRHALLTWLGACALVLPTTPTAWAQQTPATATPVAPQPSTVPPVADAAASAPANATPDARIEHLVTEDSQVRIEEDRVRGQVRKIVVQPKIRGVSPYEIAPPEPGRDPELDTRSGKRIWLSIGF